MNPILYIEDEEDYQILVKKILGRAGFEVLLAETAAEGLAALQENPSMLILDINLPDQSGYEICQQVRREPAWSYLPILMLTVKRRPEEWLQGFSSGATDYLSKPLNPPEFVERVVHALENRARPPRPAGTAEYQLIRAAVAGNRAAFDVLVKKHKKHMTEMIHNSARNSVLADELVSNAFFIAFENLKEFRGESSFYTWVYRIALNELISIHRKPNMSVPLDELAEGGENLLAQSVMEVSLEDALLHQATRKQALEVLSQMPSLYGEILELFFLEDMPYEIISKKLHIPRGTVMSRLHTARKLFQEGWDRHHKQRTALLL